MIRTYSELLTFETFEERFEYLKLKGGVGRPTFGSARMLNQAFYSSDEWKSFHHLIVIRDSTNDYVCDLGCPDRDIPKNEIVIVHHLNPITKEDILNRSPLLLDPENVICCSRQTHNALHYGNIETLEQFKMAERKKDDTVPWR